MNIKCEGDYMIVELDGEIDEYVSEEIRIIIEFLFSIETKNNFTWLAGLGINLSLLDVVNVDVGYRYVDMGTLEFKNGEKNDFCAKLPLIFLKNVHIIWLWHCHIEFK